MGPHGKKMHIIKNQQCMDNFEFGKHQQTSSILVDGN
jgi:hypothetical protein